MTDRDNKVDPYNQLAERAELVENSYSGAHTPNHRFHLARMRPSVCAAKNDNCGDPAQGSQINAWIPL